MCPATMAAQVRAGHLMAGKKERRALGRGLSALMADVAGPEQAASDAPRAPEAVIPIDRIRPNPDQPRRMFRTGPLEELANSIREKGVIQPLILRVDPGDAEAFQIVAGERRWRAAQMAQLHEVPAIIREFDDTEVLEVAIVENIQRADLNAMEEAAGYRQLMDRFNHTQDRLAEALGKSRSHIANMLRLLNLPREIQDMVAENRISAGHARAILTASDPIALAREVEHKDLSVRETENRARLSKKPSASKTGRPSKKDADTRALEDDLMAVLRMRVSIDHGQSGEGSLTIRYKTLDQLDELCQRLSATADIRLD